MRLFGLRRSAVEMGNRQAWHCSCGAVCRPGSTHGRNWLLHLQSKHPPRQPRKVPQGEEPSAPPCPFCLPTWHSDNWSEDNECASTTGSLQGCRQPSQT